MLLAFFHLSLFALQSLYSSCKIKYAVVIVYMVDSNADTLSLRASRSGTKLENTSLSTDGRQGSAYGIYHVHNSESADRVRNYQMKVSRCLRNFLASTENGQYRQNKGDLPLLRSPFLSILNIFVTRKRFISRRRYFAIIRQSRGRFLQGAYSLHRGYG